MRGIRYLFLFLAIISASAEARRSVVDEHTSFEGRRESRRAREIVDGTASRTDLREAITHFQKYALFLSLAISDLKDANKRLLGEFDHYGAKIAGYTFRSGLEAYGLHGLGTATGAAFTAGKFATGAAMTGAATSREALAFWFAHGGGKDFLVLFGLYTVGSNLASHVIASNAPPSLQDYVPVWGSIRSAYLWSKTLFGAADKIAANGEKIIALKKDLFRTEQLIAKYQRFLDKHDL